MNSNNNENAVGAILLIGAMVALGRLLTSSEQLTWRLAIGRILLGSATSMVAGVAVIQLPQISYMGLLGLASALGIAGAQIIETLVRHFFKDGR